MTQFETVVNSFQALSAEDQLSLIWKLLSLRSTSEAEGELGAIAKAKIAITLCADVLVIWHNGYLIVGVLGRVGKCCIWKRNRYSQN